LTRRGFARAGAAALGAAGGWFWLMSRSTEDEIPWPLRRMLRFNEVLARGAFRASSAAPEFTRGAGREPRVNGLIGIDPTVDPDTWRLQVVRQGAAPAARPFSLGELKALPRVEMTTELKCIEGWSTVVHWAGARLAELAATVDRSALAGRNLARYVALETPNAEYYVGLDIASALHRQTLLAYEMNGQPLTPEHGAPLRLVIPVKYGIKSLKQIGTIRFTDSHPADYWAERGYDWYAGH
jgi:DMSO/TMAO reductase YedYZ molybdopterin-dependent catalytic subunit